jgi:hypothetical protein
VVGIAWPHQVFTTGIIVAPQPGTPAVLTLTFASSTALICLEVGVSDKSRLEPGKVLIEGVGEQAAVVTGAPVETTEAQSPESWVRVEADVKVAEADVKVEADASSSQQLVKTTQQAGSSDSPPIHFTPISLAPGLSAQRAGLATVSDSLSSTPQFALCLASGQQDITTLPDWQIENALREDISLPGWDYKADPQKHLAYMKVFFDCRTMNYRPRSLWENAKTPPATLRLCRELREHMDLFLANHTLLQSLSESSKFDVQVAHVWLQHVCQNKVPHGPLLGWGKMQGHELYMHEWSLQSILF